MADFDILSTSRWNMVGGVNTFTFWMNVKPPTKWAFLLDGRQSTGNFGGYLYIDVDGLLKSSYAITEVKVNDIVIDVATDPIPMNINIKLEVSFNAVTTDHINRLFSQRTESDRCYLKGSVYAVKWDCGGDANKSSFWRMSPLMLEEGESPPTSIPSLTSSPSLSITPVTEGTSPWKDTRYLVNQELDTDLHGWNNRDDWWIIKDGMAFHDLSGNQKTLWQVFMKSPPIGTRVVFNYKFEAGQPSVYLQNESGSQIPETKLMLPVDSTEVVEIDYEITIEGAFSLAFARGNLNKSSTFSVSNIRFIEP